MGIKPLESRPIEPPTAVESVKVDADRQSLGGIQRRRLSELNTRKGEDARRPVTSWEASDRFIDEVNQHDPKHLGPLTFETSARPALDLKARVLRGTTSADGPRPTRNATGFSRATYAREGDDGVFETRRVGALAFPMGKQPRLGDPRPVAVLRKHEERALLAASGIPETAPKQRVLGNSRNTREVSTQSHGGAHASCLCCRSRSTTLRTTILRLRLGNVSRASPEAGDRAGRCDVGRRVAVAKSRYRRRPEIPLQKSGHLPVVALHEVPKGNSGPISIPRRSFEREFLGNKNHSSK